MGEPEGRSPPGTPSPWQTQQAKIRFSSGKTMSLAFRGGSITPAQTAAEPGPLATGSQRCIHENPERADPALHYAITQESGVTLVLLGACKAIQVKERLP